MLDFLKDTFGDEALTFDQLTERLSKNQSIKVVNAADGSYVPKETYNKLLAEVAGKGYVPRKELDDLKAKYDDISAKYADAQTNAEKYADFDQQLQAAKDEGAAQLNAYKRDVEISKAFSAAQVSDEVSVRANLKLDEVQLGEDGKLTGLDDQLAALKESKPYLFTQPQQQLELGGSTQGAGGDAPVKGIAGAVAEYYDK